MQNTPAPDHQRDNLLIAYSILGVLFLLGTAIYLVITAITSFDPQNISGLEANILQASSMLFCACLLLPTMVYSLRHRKELPIRPANIPVIKLWQAAILLAAWLVIVIVGSVINSLFVYGWAYIVLLFLAGLALPIAGFLWIASGGLPAGSRRRVWASLGIGMTASISIAMILEYAVVIVAMVICIAIAYVLDPGVLTTLSQLKDQLTHASDMEAMLVILSPYLTNPLIILLVGAFASGIIPLIEEAAKSLPVWLLWKPLRSPAQGFLLGAACGAGFALVEGLLAASGSAGLWGYGMAGRAAASMMHITASALLGWGIASARAEKRYGRIFGAYLLAVSLHGLWNGATLLAVFGSLRFLAANVEFDLIGGIAIVAGVGLLILVFASIAIALPMANRRLQRPGAPAPAAAEQGDIIAPPTSHIEE